MALRLGVGGALAVHGSQKLFGWFGGYGSSGTGQWMDSLGFAGSGKRNVILAGLAEFGGGTLLAWPRRSITWDLAPPKGASAISGDDFDPADAVLMELREVLRWDPVRPPVAFGRPAMSHSPIYGYQPGRAAGR